MKVNGRTREEVATGNSIMLYVVAAVVTFVMAAVLAAAIGWSGVTGVGGGTMLGFLLWLGIVLPAITVAYSSDGKTVNAIAIQLGHSLVLLVVMAGVIGAWPA